MVYGTEPINFPIIIALIFGTFLGILIVIIINMLKKKRLEEKASKLINDAIRDAEKRKRDSMMELKEESYRLKQETDREVKERKQELKEQEERLLQRESSLDKREELLQARSNNLDKKDDDLLAKQKELQEKDMKMEEILKSELERLEEISKFSKEKAHDEIMKRVSNDMALEIADYIKTEEAEAKLVAHEKAKNLIVNAMQRYANDVTSEQTTSTINLPNDEMKGRLIGREGRNIRTIESVTGVDLIIDDTPEAIVVSSFDPLRREIAKITIETLIKDGRIHPARIEELYDKANGYADMENLSAKEQRAWRKLKLIFLGEKSCHTGVLALPDSQNADKVIGNKYIWNFNRKNNLNHELYIQISKKYKAPKNHYWSLITLGIILTCLFIYRSFLRKDKRTFFKNNEV